MTESIPDTEPTPTPPPPTPQPRRNPLTIGLIVVLLVAVVAAFERERIASFLGGQKDAASQSGEAAPAQLWTCGMHPQVIQDKPGDCPICHMKLTPLKQDVGGSTPTSAGGQSSAAVAPSADGAVVTIDPAVIQNMGVRLSKVQTGPLVKSVRMVGYLEVAQPNIHAVNLRVSGWIRHLHVKTEGQHVKVGDPLFSLYSPELQAAIGEVIAARRTQAGATGVQQQTAQALYNATVRKLELLGLARKQIEALAKLDQAPEEITFVSPIEGDITQKPVVEGAKIQAGMLALEITDHSLLWLDAQAFEMDLPWLRVGQEAEATMSAMPNQHIKGKVMFIHPQVDAGLRTALVRMEIPNLALVYKPGMYAVLNVKEQVAEKATLAPREAILQVGERQVAFVALSGGRFEPRKVTVGLANAQGMVQVLSGLKPGEEVVSSGQFLIDSESRLKEAIQKFLYEKANPTTATPEAQVAQVSVVTAERAPMAKATQDKVDVLLAAYLALSKQLGAAQVTDTPLNPNPLVYAVHGLHGELKDKAQVAAVMQVATLAEALKEQRLDDQRKAFKKLSDAVIALTKMLPPSDKVGASLFLMHCPMAKGSWLQQGDVPANPYYATEMKKCANPGVPLLPQGK